MFSHLDENGRPVMVNVTSKLATKRRAQASCFLRMSPQTLLALRQKTLPKGDALSLAEVAGIQGAKWTSHLIPLCHQLEARNITVDIAFEEGGVRVTSLVEAIAPTGPEMEALVACTVAGLALYDMCKSCDRFLVLEAVHVESKSGGKSDHPTPTKELQGASAVLLTLSDRASLGIYEDTTGPAAAETLKKSGFVIAHQEIMADELELVAERLATLCDSLAPDVLLTLGSTGLSTRDIAPEATARVITREVPGIAEAFRNQFFPQHPSTAFLSRGIAGLRGKTLIVNLPGRPSAVQEGLSLLMPAFPHVLQMVRGEGHETTSR